MRVESDARVDDSEFTGIYSKLSKSADNWTETRASTQRKRCTYVGFEDVFRSCELNKIYSILEHLVQLILKRARFHDHTKNESEQENVRDNCPQKKSDYK